jgi:hypothetical protein
MRIAIIAAITSLLSLIAGWIVLDYYSGPSEAAKSAKMEAAARVKFAFESLTERLPKGKPIAPTKPLNSEARERWNVFDRRVATDQNMRAELLKALHEKTRRFFVDSPGSGAARITPEMILWLGAEDTKELAQPGEQANFPISSGEPLFRVEPSDELHFYHNNGMYDFFHAWTFGYAKDRAHVAGFMSHGIRRWGQWYHEPKHWRVEHLQLIGILLHPNPVVYLTDRLPTMEQVRQGKTRLLDYFEGVGLASLREGEDLFIAQKDDTLRMLGALRATKTCQQCHDAQVGDLLGAFSYTLRPSPAPQPETKQ